jgi:hypothetical protein
VGAGHSKQLVGVRNDPWPQNRAAETRRALKGFERFDSVNGGHGHAGIACIDAQDRVLCKLSRALHYEQAYKD